MIAVEQLSCKFQITTDVPEIWYKSTISDMIQYSAAQINNLWHDTVLTLHNSLEKMQIQ